MQRKELIAMMDRRRVEGLADFDELNGLVEKYPYCSTFQVLKAIGLKEKDSIDFSEQLNRAAIAIQDRSKLYDYIVKDQLLKRIEEAEKQVEKEDSKEDVAVEAEAKRSPEVESTTESEEKSAPISDSDSVLSSDPMETEIMREAIAHLGEMEASQRFEEFSDDENDVQEADPDQSTPDHADDEPMSFGKWLLAKDQKSTEKKNSEKALINKFIRETPQISPVKTHFFSPSQMGKLSLVEDETFVTETLANIYARQGDFKKAAKAYENLGLKYPEKSIYFAALQKKAEDQIK